VEMCVVVKMCSAVERKGRKAGGCLSGVSHIEKERLLIPVSHINTLSQAAAKNDML